MNSIIVITYLWDEYTFLTNIFLHSPTALYIFILCYFCRVIEKVCSCSNCSHVGCGSVLFISRTIITLFKVIKTLSPFTDNRYTLDYTSPVLIEHARTHAPTLSDHFTAIKFVFPCQIFGVYMHITGRLCYKLFGYKLLLIIDNMILVVLPLVTHNARNHIYCHCYVYC